MAQQGTAQSQYSDLSRLLLATLHGEDKTSLEVYLTERSNRPDPRLNVGLLEAFARLVGELVTRPDPPIEPLEALLDGWAALSLEDAPVNHPREMLPGAAVLSYGQVASVRPDWWEDEIAKLRLAAANPRWRTGEIVLLALQKMLKADRPRTTQALEEWLNDSNALVRRTAQIALAQKENQ